jgi:hypothetical protein
MLAKMVEIRVWQAGCERLSAERGVLMAVAYTDSEPEAMVAKVQREPRASR